jgi:hypothetical protein
MSISVGTKKRSKPPAYALILFPVLVSYLCEEGCKPSVENGGIMTQMIKSENILKNMTWGKSKKSKASQFHTGTHRTA